MDCPGSVLTLGVQPCCACRCLGATPVLRACTLWFGAQASLWVRGHATVVIVLPRKDAGTRAWQGGADHPRLTQTLEPPKARAPSLEPLSASPASPYREVTVTSVVTGGVSGSLCALAAGAARLRRPLGKAAEFTPALNSLPSACVSWEGRQSSCRKAAHGGTA